MQPEVRVAASADLPALVDSLGQERFFAERLGRQRAGRGLLLVASLAGTPVGDVYLWLEPAEEPELRQWLPGVPLLQHLEVRPGHRNRRIGSALIQAAEQLLAARGYTRVALGVHPANQDADRLYRRHGYREWPHPQILTSTEELRPDGSSYRRAELCKILVKDLTRI